MKQNISLHSWKSLFLVIFFTLFFLKSFDIVSHKIVNKWKIFLSYHDGYRLPSSVAAFLPFTIDIIHSDTADTVIIFTGDSTSGGLLYHHSQAIPAYLNTKVNQKINAHTFNLAFSGAHLSEQYLLINETINDADVVIFPIHFSFFSGRGINDQYISHPEIIDFIEKAENSDLEPLGLQARHPIEKSTGKFIENFWFTYKSHRLIPYITLGKPTKHWFKDKVYGWLPTSSVNSPSIRIDPTISFANQTTQVQDEILKRNKELWTSLEPINKTNPNLVYLQKIGMLKKSCNKKFLAYFIPLDIETLRAHDIFDEQVFDQIINKSKQALDEYNIAYIDFNQDDPVNLTAEHFYNPDHLLPQGNKLIGEYLAEVVVHDI